MTSGVASGASELCVGATCEAYDGCGGRRQQLEHSEGLRVQGQAALAELKREFEVLTSELLAEGQVGEAAGPGAPSPRLLAQAAAAHHRVLPGGLSMHARACTETVAK